VHAGVNTVEINTKAAGSVISVYLPSDDKTSAGMFLFVFYTLISVRLTCLMLFVENSQSSVLPLYNCGPVCLSVSR